MTLHNSSIWDFSKLRQYIFAPFQLFCLMMVFTALPACSDRSVDAGADRDSNLAHLIPWPKSYVQLDGNLIISPKIRIRVTDESLTPLANILSEEIRNVTGIKLNLSTDSRAGDIELWVEENLADDEYSIDVEANAIIRGGSYRAVAHGTTTLLQAISNRESEFLIPHLTIQDNPDSQYRGLMLDLARKWHSVETIEQVIVLCRMYKINFLQLHLTDDQSFTFPSKTFPGLATPNRHYTIEELQRLEKFATDRGVILIPEIDVPGHSKSLINYDPEKFGLSRWRENNSLVNMGKESTYRGLDILIGEIADVFRASPYIHIGGDEARFFFADEDPDIISYMTEHNLESVNELYRHFLVRMNESVKKSKKKSIVWEGFDKDGEVEIPKDMLVMAWETKYQLPQDLINAGYDVINVSWQPLYVVGDRRWHPKDIYNWNLTRWANWWRRAPSFMPIQLSMSDKIKGAQMASWEQRDPMEIPSLRSRLPAMSERIWYPDLGKGFENFSARFRHTDDLLQKIIRPAKVAEEGLSYPQYESHQFDLEYIFDEALTLNAKPYLADATLFYAEDDSEDGNRLEDHRFQGMSPQDNLWRPFNSPLTLTKSTSLWLKVLDDDGEILGWPWRTDYLYHPLSISTSELIPPTASPDPAAKANTFDEEMTLDIQSSRASGSVRYTLNGEKPSVESPVFEGPIMLTESSHVWAQVFSDDGTAMGEPLKNKYARVKRTDDSISRYQPVSTPKQSNDLAANVLVDGIIDPQQVWTADSSKMDRTWFVVDLGERKQINTVVLYAKWDEAQIYRYSIDISEDEQSWTSIVDSTNNTDTAGPDGYSHELAKRMARYIRVTMKNGSHGDLSHVIELEVR